MAWLLILWALILFFLLGEIIVRARFRAEGKERIFSFQLLLFWGLLRLEYRGGAGLKEEIVVGPISFPRPSLKGSGEALLTKVFPYRSTFLQILPILRYHLFSIRLYLAFNLGDPALTGIGVGLFYSLQGLLYPFMEDLFWKKDPLMRIQPSFNGESSIDFQGIIVTRIGYTIAVALLLMLQIQKWRRDHAPY